MTTSSDNYDTWSRNTVGSETEEAADVDDVVVTVSMPPAEQSEELREELDRLLRRAEQLQAACDDSQAKIQRTSTLMFMLILVAVGGATYWAAERDDWKIMYLAGTFFLVGALAVGYMQRVPKQHLERDRRALNAIVSLLRETETAYLYQGLLSTFELAQFRIRLSRFDISADPSSNGR